MGGVPGSYHLTGRAIDVVAPWGTLIEVAAFARRQRVTPSCTGPEEVIVEGDHLHLAW